MSIQRTEPKGLGCVEAIRASELRILQLFNFFPWKGLFSKFFFFSLRKPHSKDQRASSSMGRDTQALRNSLLNVLSHRDGGERVGAEQRARQRRRGDGWSWSLIVNQDILLGDFRPWRQLDNSICQAQLQARPINWRGGRPDPNIPPSPFLSRSFLRRLQHSLSCIRATSAPVKLSHRREQKPASIGACRVVSFRCNRVCVRGQMGQTTVAANGRLIANT